MLCTDLSYRSCLHPSPSLASHLDCTIQCSALLFLVPQITGPRIVELENRNLVAACCVISPTVRHSEKTVTMVMIQGEAASAILAGSVAYLLQDTGT
jgi:hypothetical protein